MFITIRYARFVFTRNCLDPTSGCDPLLSALIRRVSPYDSSIDGQRQEVVSTASSVDNDDDDDSVTIMQDSEFEVDGCIYRVTTTSTKGVNALCFYPRKHENPLYGTEKGFDRELAKELIRNRLNG